MPRSSAIFTFLGVGFSPVSSSDVAVDDYGAHFEEGGGAGAVPVITGRTDRPWLAAAPAARRSTKRAAMVLRSEGLRLSP